MNKQTDKKEIKKDAVVFEGRDKTLNIFQRMNLVQNSVDYVQKTKPTGMKYSIVSHDDVTAKTRPHLVRSGVLYYPINIKYTQVGNRTEVELDLIFQNIDDKEDKMSVSCLGFGCDPGDKGPGKAVSYAVKYGLLKGLGLETGDDADLEDIKHQDQEAAQSREPITPHDPEDKPIDKKNWRGPLKITQLKNILRDLSEEFRKVTDQDTPDYVKGLWLDNEDALRQSSYDLPDWYEEAKKLKNLAWEKVQ